MISFICSNDYCKEDISLIENYDKAIADKTQKWDCHHRLETELNVSAQYLKDNNLYLNRPASELIFLPHREHVSLHYKHGLIGFKGKTASKETRQKQREAKLGTKLTEDHKKKIGDSLRGNPKKPFTEEHKRKLRLAKQNYVPHNKGKKGEYKWMTDSTIELFLHNKYWGEYLDIGFYFGRK